MEMDWLRGAPLGGDDLVEHRGQQQGQAHLQGDEQEAGQTLLGVLSLTNAIDPEKVRLITRRGGDAAYLYDASTDGDRRRSPSLLPLQRSGLRLPAAAQSPAHTQAQHHVQHGHLGHHVPDCTGNRKRGKPLDVNQSLVQRPEVDAAGDEVGQQKEERISSRVGVEQQESNTEIGVMRNHCAFLDTKTGNREKKKMESLLFLMRLRFDVCEGGIGGRYLTRVPVRVQGLPDRRRGLAGDRLVVFFFTEMN
ncbi:hypothetical protein EYF80_019488 [Liparis tanakae]|uniref:Uncharacterized protein n=1 Tax=Liparis tanakae TaxID=230148 RepID=A0A4Z2HZ46_9TELE|nr:hypothetical protein EYF80_019488 [Liparis tanakae]